MCPLVFPYVGQTHEGGELEPLWTGNSAFGTGRDFQRRKEGWKRERSSRLGWVKRPEIVPRLDISNPFLAHATNRGQPSNFTIFPIFFPFFRVSPFSNRSRISHSNQTTLSKNVDCKTKTLPHFQWTFASEFSRASRYTIREKYTFTELWFRMGSALTDVWREQFFLFEAIDSVTSYGKYTLFNRFWGLNLNCDECETRNRCYRFLYPRLCRGCKFAELFAK